MGISVAGGSSKPRAGAGLNETREGINKLVKFKLSLKTRCTETIRELGMNEREGLRQLSRTAVAQRLSNAERYPDFYQAWREVIGIYDTRKES